MYVRLCVCVIVIKFRIQLNVNSQLYFNMAMLFCVVLSPISFIIEITPSYTHSFSLYLSYTHTHEKKHTHTLLQPSVLGELARIYMIILPVRKYLFNNLFNNDPAFKRLIQIWREKVSTNTSTNWLSLANARWNHALSCTQRMQY